MKVNESYLEKATFADLLAIYEYAKSKRQFYLSIDGVPACEINYKKFDDLCDAAEKAIDNLLFHH